jgi:hypothetical protein
MMAGRNISATHVAFTSTRVMATCAVIGQATGTAAALCVQSGLSPRQLAGDKGRVAELQQTLLRDDQSIKGRRSEDPRDRARQSMVTASAAQDDSPAENVINGYTRAIPGKSTNRWATELTPDGAWIELAWDRPQKLDQIQLTFDSGFPRELTLTASDSINKGIIRAPQPETVRDYTISYRKAGQETQTDLLKVEGNHQRLNRHRFEPIEAQAIRIHVRATNGDPLARIFEVRCYG